MNEEYIPLLLLGVFLVPIVIVDAINFYQCYIYFYNRLPPSLKPALPVSIVMTGIMFILLIIYAYKEASTEDQSNNTKIEWKAETV
ncbi:MAG: hypothetical protein JHC26_09970 [Thermofilum sp.]|jgi:hypothetical protein|uniref:hypothetical protein n=1 Tax=Thermofilum sp. TaxID=1961369 RepID=UPI00258B4B9D|nr:hypothetical protein [Thermofilum sp.]MCI4409409.1 hypothetical protein [Thermofilum sp.]